MTARLSERAIISAEFDQPAERRRDVRSKVLLCSSPRTASWSMCRILINAGLGVPGEYLNPQHVETLAARWGVSLPRHAYLADRIVTKVRRWSGSDVWGHAGTVQRHVCMSEYVEALLARRTGSNGVFSAKLHWCDVEPMLAINAPAANRIFGESVAVLVTRKDKVAQAVSQSAAALSGNYGFDGDYRIRAKRKPVTSCMRDLLYQDQMWRIFLEENDIPYIEVRQECLGSDAQHALAWLSSELGLSMEEDEISRAVAAEDGGRYTVNDQVKADIEDEFRSLLRLGRSGGGR